MERVDTRDETTCQTRDCSGYLSGWFGGGGGFGDGMLNRAVFLAARLALLLGLCAAFASASSLVGIKWSNPSGQVRFLVLDFSLRFEV